MSTYPLYKQCDPKWATQTMVHKTLCAVGCLLTSTAMALAKNTIRIQDATPDPASLNRYLQRNHGYVNHTDDLDENAVAAIDPRRIHWNDNASMHRTHDLSWAQVTARLDAGNVTIANVMHGRHFVLVVGYDPATDDKLYVSDPGFDRASYSFSSDVVGWRLYDMAPLESPRVHGRPS